MLLYDFLFYSIDNRFYLFILVFWRSPSYFPRLAASCRHSRCICCSFCSHTSSKQGPSSADSCRASATQCEVSSPGRPSTCAQHNTRGRGARSSSTAAPGRGCSSRAARAGRRGGGWPAGPRARGLGAAWCGPPPAPPRPATRT